MSVDKFKFAGPSIQVAEIDESRVEEPIAGVGPVIIGRTAKGPAMAPVTVSTVAELERIFGAPYNGKTSVSDVWRDGNQLAPTYATYAAKAFLQNSSPVTVIRTLGTHVDGASDSAKAGWDTTIIDQNAISQGLFLFSSGSDISGTLVAVFHGVDGTTDAPLYLRSSTGGIYEKNKLLFCSGSDVALKVLGTDTNDRLKVVSFDPKKSNFIRKVLNTDPTKLKGGKLSAHAVATKECYFLAETYESVAQKFVNSPNGYYAAMVTLPSSAKNARITYQPAESGVVVAQQTNNITGSFEPDATTGKYPVTELFKFVTLNGGEWEQSNIKIIIDNVKPSPYPLTDPYGTFDVVLKDLNTDEVLESYRDLNLNQNSPNYIAKVIGDTYFEWSYSEGRYKEVGLYPNKSARIRVEILEPVSDPYLLPFGFYGPRAPKSQSVKSSNQFGSIVDPSIYGGSKATVSFLNGLTITALTTGSVGNLYNFALISGTAESYNYDGGSATFNFTYVSGTSTRQAFIDFLTGNTNFTSRFSLSPSTLPGTFINSYSGTYTTANGTDAVVSGISASFPSISLLEKNTKALSRTTWGFTYDKNYYDVKDLVRINPITHETDKEVGYPTCFFSLDDIGSTGTGSYSKWEVGLRKSGKSYSSSGSADYKETLKYANSFAMPLFGGFDGVNIFEKEPIVNNALLEGKTAETSYAYNTLDVALKSVSDKEVIETDIICVPGLTESSLIQQLIDVCEQRGDAMALIDIEEDFKPEHESTESLRDRLPNVQNAIESIKGRALDSTYAAAYYPAVYESTQNIFLPATVAALGVMGGTEGNSALWFAPAGFIRGGISQSTAGLSVSRAAQHLTAKERDELYNVNVNPLATFPNEGVVVFGQKTLQAQPSALSRINVRRLMNYIKRNVSTAAKGVLFEPNVEATWNNFKNRIEPFLKLVKSNFGLEDFRVILDSRTTTADLIDRNIMYAKVLLKPTRTIEYIAVDFVISNSGAVFTE